MVKYWPCAENGIDEPNDDVMVDEPSELVGKEVYFRVEIDGASNLPADLCKNVFVTYQFKHEPGLVYSTGEFEGQT
jgi:FKBP-type peptidyl-prolyl cis-trans isomerase 2